MNDFDDSIKAMLAAFEQAGRALFDGLRDYLPADAEFNGTYGDAGDFFPYVYVRVTTGGTICTVERRLYGTTPSWVLHTWIDGEYQAHVAEPAEWKALLAGGAQ